MVSIKGNPGPVLSSCCWLPSDGASPRLCLPIQSQSDSRRTGRLGALAKHSPFPPSESEIFLFFLDLKEKGEPNDIAYGSIIWVCFYGSWRRAWRIRQCVMRKWDNPTAGLSIRGLRRNYFWVGNSGHSSVIAWKGLHFCLYNVYHILIAFRHRSNSEIDLIEFIEIDDNVRY